MVQSNRLEITPLNTTIGAVLRGVDLREGASDQLAADIRGALLKHQVVFFEGQALTPTQQKDFALNFGALHVHPLYPGDAAEPEIMVLDNHDANPSDNDHWHTDVTFIETPPLGAILLAETLPERGGDTLWSSMTAAYKALSKPMRAFLAGLEAVHDYTHAFPPTGLAGSAAGRERWEKGARENPPVVHPVVRTHPETGEPALFVNSVFTARIKGLRGEESRALMDFLNRHVQQPEFLVRWTWTPGDMAFWDNRCTQHYAVNDYLPACRVMRRATILDDKPFYRAAH